jgi:hypothetical protein
MKLDILKPRAHNFTPSHLSLLGPSILSELIQNADDARASTVKVLYNTRSYGTSSLLGKKMAKWQGPCLCVYNDAAFSSRDFQNLVKIGQVLYVPFLNTSLGKCSDVSTKMLSGIRRSLQNALFTYCTFNLFIFKN